MVSPCRLLLPSEAVPHVFGGGADVGFANKADDCVAFCVDVSAAVGGDTHVVKIVGTHAQQEAECQQMFLELCAFLGRAASEACVLSLVIPSRV